MKYTYKFVNGESMSIDVSEELESLLKNEDRLEYNNDHANTRRHVPLDTSKDGGEDWLVMEDENLRTLFADEPDVLQMHRAMEQLKPRQRELLYAIYITGISVKEYAAREGVDHSSISHRLRVAEKNLKKFL
jgi:DNA-directed RNA polymerase specialized sigma24 family protein